MRDIEYWCRSVKVRMRFRVYASTGRVRRCRNQPGKVMIILLRKITRRYTRRIAQSCPGRMIFNIIIGMLGADCTNINFTEARAGVSTKTTWAFYCSRIGFPHTPRKIMHKTRFLRRVAGEVSRFGITVSSPAASYGVRSQRWNWKKFFRLRVDASAGSINLADFRYFRPPGISIPLHVMLKVFQ